MEGSNSISIHIRGNVIYEHKSDTLEWVTGENYEMMETDWCSTIKLQVKLCWQGPEA